MLRSKIASELRLAVQHLVALGQLPPEAGDLPVEVLDTKMPEHGDYATNFAMIATKRAGMPPRKIAELLQAAIAESTHSIFERVEIAGPGFLNLYLTSDAITGWVGTILDRPEMLSSPELENATPLKINVEFVSVNPNGPITVGSGRGAAFGSTLCNCLAAVGHQVHREYYINDGVNSEQMRQFAASVMSFVEETPFPEKGYRGEYVQDVAKSVSSLDVPKGDIAWYQRVSQDLMLERQRQDLAQFGVYFDTWFSEQSLHVAGDVQRRIDELLAKGVADEEPHRAKVKFGKGGVPEEVEIEAQIAEAPADDEEFGEAEAGEAVGNTLWLRSTKFGDDMDRVLKRRDGRLTYIASDVAYHADKLNRPPDADKLITILGPDHHGYIGRLHAVFGALLERPVSVDTADPLTEEEAKIYRSPEERVACLAALAEAKARLEVVIFQIVRFVKDGKPAPMRKRDGNIYELRDLISELGYSLAPNASPEEQQRIGSDVSRFFYLSRSHDSHMDFDIDLATKQSEENPVFYAQYAHARICSILQKGEAAGFAPSQDYALLTHPRELGLVKKILDLPFEIERCSRDYGVHRLTTYAVELARTYHHFYDACRVLQPEEPALSGARLALCRAAQLGLKATFDLLGVSAPERMDRTPGSDA